MERVDTLAIRWKKELPFFLTTSLVLIIDQVTKLLVRSNMSLEQSIPAEGFFRLTFVTNTGGIFGILANQTLLIILTAAVGIAALLLYYRYPLFQDGLVKVGLGLLLGGAIGNLIDRIYLEGVVDFIDIGAWPVFNLADSAIVIGIIILAYFSLSRYRKRKRGVTKPAP